MVKATGMITITAVYDGKDGFDIKSNLIATLTKNHCTIPKDKTGVIPSYSGARTELHIYDGITDVTDDFTITVVADGLTGTLAGNIYTVSEVSGTSGTATFTATDGTETFTKVFSVFVSSTTTDELVTCEILPSSLAFISKRGHDGLYKPAVITLESDISNATFSKWQYSFDGSTYIDVPNSYIVSGTNNIEVPYNSDIIQDGSTEFRLLTNKENVYDDVSLLKIYNSENYFITKSPDEPEDPELGDMWLDTDTGDIYVYDYVIYKDGLRIDENNHLINSDGYLVNSYGHLLDEDGNQITPYASGELITYYIIDYDGYYIGANNERLNEDFAIMDDEGHFRDSNDNILVAEFDEEDEELKYFIMRPDGTPDKTQPATPVLGTPKSSTGPVVGEAPQMAWVSSSNSDIKKVDYTKIKTFTTPPYPPYNAGDVWFVQNTPQSEIHEGSVPFDANEVGYVKVCVVTKLEGEEASASDWFTPESAYTPLTSIEVITGKTASEWYASSKNITSMINDVTDDVVSVEEQVSNLVVRSSEIEMSFSHSGTSNYLYNSSGQYNLNRWRNRSDLSQKPDAGITVGSINQYKDTRYQIKSGYMFRLGFKDSSHLTDGMISDPIPFPTGNIYSISFKYRNLIKNTALKIKLIPYSDDAGTVPIQLPNYESSISIPYSDDYDFHTGHFYFYKNQFANQNIECLRVEVAVESLFTLPVIELDYSDTSQIPNPQMFLGRRVKLNNDHIYLAKSMYTKITPVEFDDVPDYSLDDRYNAIWLCGKDIITEENLRYVKGIYYLFTGFHSYSYTYMDGSTEVTETRQAPTFIPFSDSYEVTLLDQDQYYIQRVYGFEDITSQSTVVTNENPDDCIALADIMVNGGSTVMTWTTSKYESIYTDTIKFSAYGIEITGAYEVSEGQMVDAKRIINEKQDVAYTINSQTGDINKIIWNIDYDGVMVNNYKGYGSISLGYARNQDGTIDETNQGKWTQVYKMTRNTSNEGVDEYIFIN